MSQSARPATARLLPGGRADADGLGSMIDWVELRRRGWDPDAQVFAPDSDDPVFGVVWIDHLFEGATHLPLGGTPGHTVHQVGSFPDLIDHDIVFRVEQRSHTLTHFAHNLAFEVDHIDNAGATGRSVLLRGEAAAVEEEAVPDLIHATEGRFPKLWAAGVHNTWIRLTPRLVTGRRVAAPFSALVY
jgi:hypothetical protein